MQELIAYSVEAGTAFLSLQNPPVNAATQPFRVALMDALDRAEEDESVDQIVLIGTGGQFCAGADLAEYDSGVLDPPLREVCERLDYAEKPVTAALSGTVYGGGMELALAAHYRIALKGTRLGLPETRLGLPPSAGGSQRLPRLVGAKLALDMMLRARILTAEAPEARLLIDGLAEGDLRVAAARFAAALRKQGKAVRLTRDMTGGFEDMQTYLADLSEARDDTKTGMETAPARILALVEAAPLLPFEAGCAMEEDAFETCLASPTSRALRHIFRAERVARRFVASDLPQVPRIDRIAVLGGGPLAAHLSVGALNAGLAVQWGTRDAEALAEGRKILDQIFRQLLSKQPDPAAALTARTKNLVTGESAEMVNGADIILHAARGQGDVPAPADMVRAVAMAGRVDALGLRFAPPVFGNKLLEIIEGPDCTPAQLATALGLADRMGKTAVQVRSTGISVAGKLFDVLHRAADALVDLGVHPYEIDHAVQTWGWASAPFQTRDQMGLAEFAQATRETGATNWSARLQEAGREGRAGGKGFYVWSAQGAGRDPDLDPLLDRPASDGMSPDRVTRLLIGAMANEGLRMLRTGMVQRVSDIDVVSVHGLQMPRWKGGVMHAASEEGLLRIKREMTEQDHVDAALWTPEPLWDEHIKNGKRLGAL